MEPQKPPVFTPFLRRFTDERAKDLSDTAALYARVRKLHARSRFATRDGEIEIGATIWRECRDLIPEELKSPFHGAIRCVLAEERVIFEFPKLDPKSAHLSLKEASDLRHFLRSKEHFHTNEARVVELLARGLGTIFHAVAEHLPQIEMPTPFTIPLILTLPEPKAFLDNLIGELWQQPYIDAGLFVEVSRQIYLNMCRISGIADPYDPKKPFKRVQDFDGSITDAVDEYLGGTPFRDLLLAPVPLRFSYEDRFSHMHVLGGSGAGKTTLLQNLILHDLKSDNPPALVIVDSQGDLISNLSRLALFDPDTGSLADRFLLITPKDTKHPPALNIFDVNRDRLGAYDEAAKEQVTAGVIQTFDYLFAGLLGADLTAKQGIFFRFVARLMLALPETMGRTATILDMLGLMDDVAPFKEAIESLPPIQRQFFERDFPSKTFVQTKEQIRYRLNAILENPTLARLFTAPKTKIDLFDTLNNGGIVLVDTAKDFLKGSSGHFGRIFISLVLQAVLERAVIPEAERRPVFLVVDEAAAYFDTNIDDFLTEARKYKCGCVFAHQFLDQATSSLRASLAANTAIKLAGGVSTADARALAPDMRTTADFILSQPRLHFAAHIRNVTPGAISMPVPVGGLEAEPRLSGQAYERLRERNRRRVALDRGEEKQGSRSPPDAVITPHAPGPAVTPKPSADPTAPSEDW